MSNETAPTHRAAPTTNEADQQAAEDPGGFGTVGPEPDVGAEFAGYTLVRCLGRGGMGDVFLAEHPRLSRRIALKVLRADHLGDDEFRRRFKREADVVARLDHPGIVDVYDCGDERGRWWIAMQFVAGHDAAQEVRRLGGMATGDVARIVGDLAAALDHAHRHGVIHRDVKPANVLLRRDAVEQYAMLADFGIALPAIEATRITTTDNLVGSIDYTAPERLTNSEVGPFTDQYSLACTAYHLLTGELPFYRDRLTDSVVAHLSAPPPSACERRADLHWLTDRVLARALSKAPDDRYATCGDFAADLIGALRTVPETTPRPPRPAPPHPTHPPHPAAPPARPYASQTRTLNPHDLSGTLVDRHLPPLTLDDPACPAFPGAPVRAARPGTTDAGIIGTDVAGTGITGTRITGTGITGTGTTGTGTTDTGTTGVGTEAPRPYEAGPVVVAAAVAVLTVLAALILILG
ncbi:MAG: serine/threonine-protein kinase [Gordonia sp. (in: high G+C Gram-positive bacteria)]|uniref:serine/threonine-protein kinase n=1 Tax=Gordonia sp. (in: high G+C Gram-positive bacteria) TaxID=84139 RepID=UPI003C7538A6